MSITRALLSRRDRPDLFPEDEITVAHTVSHRVRAIFDY